MPTIHPKYSLERDLVNDFCTSLVDSLSPWGSLNTSREFSYGRGRADVIASNQSGVVIAFEAKLYRWRDALQQAYRNKCFANQSYVLLPEYEASSAMRYSYEFSRRSVGLCTLSDQKIMVFLDFKVETPLQRWLHEKAIDSTLPS